VFKTKGKMFALLEKGELILGRYHKREILKSSQPEHYKRAYAFV